MARFSHTQQMYSDDFCMSVLKELNKLLVFVMKLCSTKDICSLLLVFIKYIVKRQKVRYQCLCGKANPTARLVTRKKKDYNLNLKEYPSLSLFAQNRVLLKDSLYLPLLFYISFFALIFLMTM